MTYAVVILLYFVSAVRTSVASDGSIRMEVDDDANLTSTLTPVEPKSEEWMEKKTVAEKRAARISALLPLLENTNVISVLTNIARRQKIVLDSDLFINGNLKVGDGAFYSAGHLTVDGDAHFQEATVRGRVAAQEIAVSGAAGVSGSCLMGELQVHGLGEINSLQTRGPSHLEGIVHAKDIHAESLEVSGTTSLQETYIIGKDASAIVDAIVKHPVVDKDPEIIEEPIKEPETIHNPGVIITDPAVNICAGKSDGSPCGDACDPAIETCMNKICKSEQCMPDWDNSYNPCVTRNIPAGAVCSACQPNEPDCVERTCQPHGSSGELVCAEGGVPREMPIVSTCTGAQAGYPCSGGKCFHDRCEPVIGTCAAQNEGAICHVCSWVDALCVAYPMAGVKTCQTGVCKEVYDPCESDSLTVGDACVYPGTGQTATCANNANDKLVCGGW